MHCRCALSRADRLPRLRQILLQRALCKRAPLLQQQRSLCADGHTMPKAAGDRAQNLCRRLQMVCDLRAPVHPDLREMSTADAGEQDACVLQPAPWRDLWDADMRYDYSRTRNTRADDTCAFCRAIEPPDTAADG